jgi:hypothetical protein
VQPASLVQKDLQGHLDQLVQKDLQGRQARLVHKDLLAVQVLLVRLVLKDRPVLKDPRDRLVQME